MTEREKDSVDVSLWRAAYENRPESATAIGEQPEERVAAEVCLDDFEMANLVVGDLADADRLRAADHIVVCSHCRARYRVALELHEAAGAQRQSSAVGPGESADRAMPPRSLKRWVAAATLAFTLVGGAWILRSKAPSEVTRGWSSATSTQPADGEVLESSPRSLVWAVRTDPGSYQVRLFDEQAEPLWQDAIDNAAGESLLSLSLPNDLRDRLVPGRAYFWVVEGEGALSHQRLGPVWFQLKGE